jgi:bifunctional non-homologous end joining protein LigD
VLAWQRYSGRGVTAEPTSGRLREYRARRDFRRTPEPDPGRSARGQDAQAPAGARARPAGGRFVVHEHHARHLHWDLRLEHAGTLASWAIPHGIPQDPRENRKAIHVEDHPLSYLDFEGEIPAGAYGAGRVLIWDSGVYDCEKRNARELIVVFHGARLRGRYALFRAGEEERDWMIHRMDPPPPTREAMPEHLLPMLASPGRLPRTGEGWAFEVKWDGVRVITYWQPGRMRIESRNLNDVSLRYPELRGLSRQLGAREAVLDGELVVFDDRGAPSFERLQQRMHLSSPNAVRRAARTAPVTYVIFDLLYLDERLTTGLPYRERRALLQELELKGAHWQTPAYHQGRGVAFLAATAERGLEGAVAKRLDSPYRPGERSEEWLKIKNLNRQELVIGGWLEGQGRRQGQLGALLMGYYEGTGRARALRYAGRVGTGFDEPELERLAAELRSRPRRSSPFGKHGVQPPREAHFVKPELVAEIEFSRWTREGILRHSSYKGLRTDRPAREVELEEAGSQEAGSHGAGSQEAGSQEAGSQGAGSQEAGLQGAGWEGAGLQGAGWEGAGSEGAGLEESAGEPYQVLHQTRRFTEIAAQGRTLRLTNREKVLYPGGGFTKGQLVDYYAAVAPVLLPHLAGRPLTLKRCPDGVEGEHFYEKRCPSHRPEWVRTTAVWSERQRERIDYCVVEDLPALLWTANLAAVELHPSLARARDPYTPTALVFDLDPGPPAGLRECCRVASWIRELLELLGLQTVVKTSGAKGLQVYVPLNTEVAYEQTKTFAHAVARLLEKQHPKLVLSRMTKSLRAGKVLIDWSQNDPHKTTVCVYSLRARERPAISTPLSWEEVEQAARRRREPELSAEPAELLARVERHGDLCAPLLALTQTLPDFSGAQDTA